MGLSNKETAPQELALPGTRTKELRPLIETSVPKVQHPSTRELRGIALYRDHADEIRFERGVWLVPSLSEATTVYEVRIGTRGASCECADHCFRGVPCMHVHAATIARAKTRTCAGCSGRFRGRDLFEVGDDDLTYFESDELCRSCAPGHAL
jgi:hypothetical protein